MRCRKLERDAPPRPAAQAQAGRVLEDVLGHGAEVVLVLDDAAREPALEEVALPVVAPVEADRVEAVEALHPGREVGLGRVHEHVEVVAEQVPRSDVPAVATLDRDEELVPSLPVAVVEHDPSLLDAAGRHVVPGGARQLRAGDSRHGSDGSSA
jgi:hypothetical protein